jgi:hypothetical protein
MPGGGERQRRAAVAPCLGDFHDLVGWLSPSGVSRALYVNPSWNDAWIGVGARLWLTVLLLVPLALGLAEVALGLQHRNAAPKVKRRTRLGQGGRGAGGLGLSAGLRVFMRHPRRPPPYSVPNRCRCG